MKRFPRNPAAHRRAGERIARAPVACALALALLACPAPAILAKDDPAAARAVRKLLDKRQLRYRIDEAGDFQIVFDLGEGRTQMAYLRPAVVAFGKARTREILSTAYQSDTDPFPPAIANRLLELNAGLKLGAFAKQGRSAVMIVKVPADAGADELNDALEATVRAADAFEKSVGGQDLF